MRHLKIRDMAKTAETAETEDPWNAGNYANCAVFCYRLISDLSHV